MTNRSIVVLPEYNGTEEGVRSQETEVRRRTRLVTCGETDLLLVAGTATTACYNPTEAQRHGEKQKSEEEQDW
jgi:hypothetical protein